MVEVPFEGVSWEDTYLFEVVRLSVHNGAWTENQLLQFFSHEVPYSVVTSLSKKYSDSVVILLCDEVKNGMSADWSNMKTCQNVIWLLAVNPRSDINKKIKLKIVPPTTDQVLSHYMEIKYRNCIQIRYYTKIL